VTTTDEFYGRRELLTDLDRVPCKANWLAARRRYVESHFGDSGVRDVASRLEAEATRRSFLEPPLPMSWSDVATVVAIDRAIFEGPMNLSYARMREFGGEIATYDVNGVYRAFFRLATPRFVFSRIGTVWSQYFRRGSLACETRERDADIHLHDVVMPRYLCQHGIPGWFDTMLGLVGARAPSVRHPSCIHAGADHCVWNARWSL
jgi:hypothetical protein